MNRSDAVEGARAARRRLIAEVEDWRTRDQSIDQLLFRMRTCHIDLSDGNANQASEIEQAIQSFAETMADAEVTLPDGAFVTVFRLRALEAVARNAGNVVELAFKSDDMDPAVQALAEALVALELG